MKHIAFWTETSSPDESLSFISKLALSHALEGGEQGKHIASCITSGDFLSLCDFDVDYETTSAWHASNCRQALAYFTKYAALDLGRDRRQVAIDQFKATEVACSQTNDIFRLRALGSFLLEPWVESVLFRAQQKIARILGDCPKFEDLRYRFGPGATTLTKKRNASVVEKLQAGISCSEDLAPYASRILSEMPHLAELHSTGVILEDEVKLVVSLDLIVNEGLVDFVPKNAKTHRTIIKEGSLNTMVQAALGDYMSDRLRAFGIDLSDQSVNQKWALKGSLDGSVATLDLSSASDTISTELVVDLLPYDWAAMLSVCRSSAVKLDGSTIQLEKFSSMGNGFTFPLESLIFWALSSAASEDNFASVYGDDIVVSTGSVARVIRVLEICGFTINTKKSFCSGSFRESCGADYIRGIDIRPVYQKKLISPMELFRLHNYYVRRGDEERANLIREQLNPSFHIFGPDNYGDGHLLGDWIPKRHKRWNSHGYGGVLFDTFKLSACRDKRALRKGDRVLPLYATYIRENGGSDVLDRRFDEVGSPSGFLRRLRFQTRILGEPIPERVSAVDGSHVKCDSLPGTEGYHKVSIYTFDTGR